jgi:hypothetical protein
MAESDTTAVALRQTSDPITHELKGRSHQDSSRGDSIFTAAYRAKQVDFNGWPPDRPTAKIVLQWLIPFDEAAGAAPHQIELSGPFIPELYSIYGCYEVSIRRLGKR